MKRVVLTGSEGTVGRVLTGRSLVDGDKPALDATITRVDVTPDKGGTDSSFIQSDLKDRDLIKHLLETYDVFIHGAWNTQEGILQPDSIDLENVELAKRILACIEELGERAIAKLVLLGSVNAHVPSNWRMRREAQDYIDIEEEPQPNRHNRNTNPGGGTTHYGESKVAIEQAAKHASENGAHIVIPRLGGVNLRDRISSGYEVHQTIYQDPDRGKYFDAGLGGWEDAVRLTHNDLVANIQDVVDADVQPGTFLHYNLVSDTPDRVHKLPKDET
ncbi:MAG: NAD-dependent epimerase/dehydratase family protein [Candidatus Microsaccharimonas sp.]